MLHYCTLVDTWKLTTLRQWALFRWIYAPASLLSIFLQRSPIVRQAEALQLSIGNRSAALIRSAMTAAALGNWHTLAGATQLSTNPVSPATARLGEPFSMAFSFVDAPTSAGSYEILGALPPGLTVPGLSGNLLNGSSGTITGTPTVVGSYDLSVRGWNGANKRGEGGTISYTITIRVQAADIAPPTIATHPQSQTVAAGQTITLRTVALGGAALRYQWQKDGVAISGATSEAYFIPSVVPGHAGVYKVVVTNDGGSVVSGGAQVTVHVPPTIESQPKDQSVSLGERVFLSVGVTGSEPLTYRWYRNGTEVIGATGPLITIDEARLSDSGEYRVRVINPANRITGAYIDGVRQYAMFLKADGSIWAAGSGGNGLWGGSTPIQAENDVADALVGNGHTLFLKRDGTLLGMGVNLYGQLGDGTTTTRSIPVRVSGDVVSAATGQNHTMFVKRDGSLWASGRNQYGQLGDGTQNNRSTPIQIATGVVRVVAGEGHTAFLKIDGSLWTVGRNHVGQLGDGTLVDRSTPVQVASGVASIMVGRDRTMFVKSDGTLWGVGENTSGTLGDGTMLNRSTPVQVASAVVSVVMGEFHTMFVKSDGTLWGTGVNNFGALGDGTTINRSRPVQVASDVASVSLGYDHTMFVKTDGTLWGMGVNSDGRLGDGSTAHRLSPVLVATNVVSVVAGQFQTMFLKMDGTLWGMGTNRQGQLGDGTTINRSTPVLVAGGLLSSAAALTVNALPVITVQPLPRAVVLGRTTSLSVAASGAAPLSYRWSKDGALIAGANASTYTINDARQSDAGIYSVTVTNSLGSVTSENIAVAVGSDLDRRLVSLSCRASVPAEGISASFTVPVGGAKRVLIRGAGPALASFGVPGVLANPQLTIRNASGVTVGFNDDWGSVPSLRHAMSDVGVFAFLEGSRDAAWCGTLSAGTYTVTLTSVGGDTGQALMELYDADTTPLWGFSYLAMQARMVLGTEAMIVGVGVSGTSPTPVLVRALGPSLGPNGITDPKLQIYNGSRWVFSNNDWSADAAVHAATSAVGASPLPADSKESAAVLGLQGGHAVHVSGVSGTAGVARAEFYLVSDEVAAPLKPIISRQPAGLKVEAGHPIVCKRPADDPLSEAGGGV